MPLGTQSVDQSCADPENSISGDPEFFYSSKYLTEDSTNLTREAIGPESNCRSRRTVPVFLSNDLATYEQSGDPTPCAPLSLPCQYEQEKAR